MSGTLTSTFKVGTGGRFACHSFPGLSGVFPTIFVLYSNYLPSLALSLTYSNRLYIGITISRSSPLSINVLLIFEMHDLNGELFLNATSFTTLWFSFAAVAKRSIVLSTTIYASL